jgi:glycosyltransferase involved in cell wall biosynthesis
MAASQESAECDVTVVIPAYQRADLVGRAVHSALLQRPRARAVLVVDDGSTDGTAAVAEAAGATVLRQANQGEGAARNAGLRAATTTWVALLDSDDQWLPGHLAAMTGGVGSPSLFADTGLRAEDVLVVGTVARAVPSGRLVGYPGGRPRRLRPVDLLWPDNLLLPSATMVRREAALAIGGFGGERRAGDLDFWVRLLETGLGLVVPEVTCVYHLHGGQVSASLIPMQEAREVVTARYADREWFPDDLLDRVQYAAGWDRFRHAAWDRDWRRVAAELGGLMRPAAVGAVAETLRFRAAVRRR